MSVVTAFNSVISWRSRLSASSPVLLSLSLRLSAGTALENGTSSLCASWRCLAGGFSANIYRRDQRPPNALTPSSAQYGWQIDFSVTRSNALGWRNWSCEARRQARRRCQIFGRSPQLYNPPSPNPPQTSSGARSPIAWEPFAGHYVKKETVVARTQSGVKAPFSWRCRANIPNSVCSMTAKNLPHSVTV